MLKCVFLSEARFLSDSALVLSSHPGWIRDRAAIWFEQAAKIAIESGKFGAGHCERNKNNGAGGKS